ncbi:hypothetical protein BS50DRAFT_639562 [Corynespora cassiicola Philippines]|uniref:Uncharacterized protein n=1 Tax=Corynespora cassiicola Philippines TaxID=1448308 RepID=A0A2T2N7W1_CORCC|nr:hypothetical protein BS50DRAFT_639562 [Corynespora cassiicola Philippines]
MASPAVELFNRFDNVGTPRPNTEGEVIETIATEQMAQLVLLLPDVTWQTDCEMESEQEYEGEERSTFMHMTTHSEAVPLSKQNRNSCDADDYRDKRRPKLPRALNASGSDQHEEPRSKGPSRDIQDIGFQEEPTYMPDGPILANIPASTAANMTELYRQMLHSS